MVEEVNSKNAFQNALSEESIAESFDRPIGCDPLRELIKGKKKIVIMTDDLSRPTPTNVVLPLLIKYLRKNGISNENILIISASGSHEPISDGGKKLKYGTQLYAKYRIVGHNCNNQKELRYIGRSKFGTPIHVNRSVTKSDFLISIGGIYPAPPIGFSGGPNIVLGICGRKTIQHLHYQRTAVKRGSIDDCTMRADLFDIAKRIGLNFIINVLVCNKRQITHMFVGDLEKAYALGTKKAKKICAVRPPGDEDVVIANTYPFDTSLIFARKGWWPVICAKHDGLRIIIAGLPQGIGNHPFWPFFPGRNDKIKQAIYYYNTLSAKEILVKGFSKLKRKMLKKKKANSSPVKRKNKIPVFCYVPNHSVDCPGTKEFLLFKSWDELLNKAFEYGFNKRSKVVFYQSSSLVYPEQ